ncbi:MAG TPA: DUF2007 domain-containing protein [Chitinophagaceae bacterium]|nr:DUF2007 domain-containing protein [Chitinophagaceae bacterium]
MEKDWVVVFTSTEPFESDFVKGMLEENGIPAVIINGRDSEFGTFGVNSLYVHVSQAEKAVQLVKEKKN